MTITAALAVGAATLGAAQGYTPPPPPLTTLAPCPASADVKKRAKRKDCDPTVYPSESKVAKPSKQSDTGSSPSDATAAPAPATLAAATAAQQFPFPGEQPAQAPGASAAKAYPYPGERAAEIPHDPAAAAKAAGTSAGKAFPFPGEATPDMPTDSAEPPARPDSSSSSSSAPESADSQGSASSSSASRNPDDDDDADKPNLKDEGSEGSSAKSRRGKKVVKQQTDTERVDEDLSVAKYYSESGNVMGAYLRAKDAVKSQPDFPEAHFVLAEAARRLKKRDEAVAEFTAYLKLAPDGARAKASEKALDEIR